MVKITQELSDFEEIEEGQKYIITEIITTEQKGEDNEKYDGLSISFKPLNETAESKKKQIKVTAWLGSKGYVGTRSKLGAFKSAFVTYFEKTNDIQTALTLAEDTDNWLKHTIKVLEWRNKNREIKVIE